MTTSENIHSLTAPYALDALDELERARFERHLAEGCADCIEEVTSFLDTVAALGHAVEQPEVSESLRAHAAEVPDTVRQVGPVQVARRSRTSDRVVRTVTSVAAAVLTVAVVGLSVVTLTQSREIDRLEQDAVIASVLRQPDAVTMSTTATGDGIVRVVASPDSDTSAVVAAGLEPAPPDRTYQLWLIDDAGEPRSAGFLEVGDDGTGEQLVVADLADVTAFGVSVEPAGGSQAPTTDPIAVVELDA